MINEEQKEKNKQVEILTDFDRTMIVERSPYIQINAYYLHLDNLADRMNLRKKSITGYFNYRITKDPRIFYSLLKECPIDVIDKTVNKYHQDKWWNLWIKEQKINTVGILSQNSIRVISNYLDIHKEQPAEIKIIEANEPEIKNKIYTGKVKIRVNNKNLADYIGDKDYICKEERKILQNDEFIFKKIGHGLWICSKKKIFEIVK